MTDDTCKDCEMRCVGCHGKNEDGTWRCRKWGILQDRKAEERQKTAGARLTAMVGGDYARENSRRLAERKKHKHFER